jgi:hypothetical protein
MCLCAITRLTLQAYIYKICICFIEISVATVCPYAQTGPDVYIFISTFSSVAEVSLFSHWLLPKSCDGPHKKVAGPCTMVSYLPWKSHCFQLEHQSMYEMRFSRRWRCQCWFSGLYRRFGKNILPPSWYWRPTSTSIKICLSARDYE